MFMFNNRDEIKCREKWLNVLDPQVKNQPFTKEEDEIICRETSSININISQEEKDSQNSMNENDGIYRYYNYYSQNIVDFLIYFI